jgi:hypothetical protein
MSSKRQKKHKQEQKKEQKQEPKGSALPKAYIVPIRLAIYSVLAICSGYIYFNVGDLGITHYLIIISVVAVAAMALLDCRVSDDYWKREAAELKKAEKETADR